MCCDHKVFFLTFIHNYQLFAMMNKVFNHLLSVTYRYTKLILLCNILILYKNLHMYMSYSVLKSTTIAFITFF